MKSELCKTLSATALMIKNVRNKLEAINASMPPQSKEALLHKQCLVASVLSGEISKKYRAGRGSIPGEKRFFKMICQLICMITCVRALNLIADVVQLFENCENSWREPAPTSAVLME